MGAEPGAVAVKRGRPKVELTPEQQAAKLAERRAAQGAGRDAIRTAQRSLRTIETPFDEGAFATDEALKSGAEQRNAEVVEALVNAYRIANDPAQRKNKAGEVARAAIRGLDKAQLIIIPDLSSKAFRIMNAIMPSLMDKFLDKIVDKVRDERQSN